LGPENGQEVALIVPAGSHVPGAGTPVGLNWDSSALHLMEGA
jgi:hypothetical protein